MKIIFPIIDLHKADNKPLGIMTISSLLKNAGNDVEVVNADFKDIKRKVQKESFFVVGYSTPTAFFPYYLNLNRQIKKEFSAFSVFGGPHPTYFPQMIEESGIDGICIGEGEYPMLELVEHLEKGKPIEKIDNWWIKKDGEIYRNPIRPLIEDLDQLPLPDHEIYEKEIPNNNWCAYVITGRGCPYSCTYCFNHVSRKLYEGKGKYIRRRSVDNVIEELEKIKSKKTYEFVRFFDDIFTLSEEWIVEFAAKYKTIGIPFSCLVRANFVKPDIIRLLKEAGCRTIFMGLESGNDYIRNEILQRNMSREDILTASQFIRQNGIKLVTGNMLGIPGGTLESDLETLQLNVRCRPSWASVTLLQPYHGTKIHQLAQGLGLIEREKLDMNEQSVWRVSALKYKDRKEKKHIENLQKFFGIVVEFPFLLPIVKILIKFPQNKLYNFIFGRWVNYCWYFRVFPPQVGIKNMFKRAKTYKVIYDWFKKNSLKRLENHD